MILLGCIGDDFTGSSDLGNTLARQGMRTVQYAGVPKAPAGEDVEAGIVALKSRTVPPEEAVTLSLAALEWLQAQGCRQFLFKYCSTFDSTKKGNIGPVLDALAEKLQADRVIVCPAFPSLNRSIYKGHLFVGDRLLNESGMENHPLTPMTDADLRRWLGYQSRNNIGHVDMKSVAAGERAIATALDAQAQSGNRLVVVDAISDDDLLTIGAAADGLPLVSGGSGIALGLPENFRRRGEIGDSAIGWQGAEGPCVVLSGSCSIATQAQVAYHRQRHPAFEITADAVMAGEITAAQLADWTETQDDPLPLIFSTADPKAVRAAQQHYGRERVAAAIERLTGETAHILADRGYARIVSAGGETSGAVVEALAAEALEIGPEIDPGVPALKVRGRNLALALKSGNFGGEDFFERAASALEA